MGEEKLPGEKYIEVLYLRKEALLKKQKACKSKSEFKDINDQIDEVISQIERFEKLENETKKMLKTKKEQGK